MPVSDLPEWAAAGGVVLLAHDIVGDVLVSTVFVGIDQNPLGDPPILFETIAFNKQGDAVAQHRCETLAEAHKLHKAVVECQRNALSPEDEAKAMRHT